MGLEFIGREIEFTAIGKTWRFSRWNLDMWSRLVDFARTKLPDPLEVATKNIDKVVLKDAEIMRELIRRDDAESIKATKEGTKPILMAPLYKQKSDTIIELAMDKACNYLSFNSPEMNSFMRSTVGASHFMWLLLLKHHPDVSEDDAYEINMALSQQSREKDDPKGYFNPIEQIIATTQGRAESKPKNG